MPTAGIDTSPLVQAQAKSISAVVNKPKTENNVIKIIQREWEKEVERLDAKKNGYKPK